MNNAKVFATRTADSKAVKAVKPQIQIAYGYHSSLHSGLNAIAVMNRTADAKHHRIREKRRDTKRL